MKKLRSLLIGICLIIGLLFLGTVWLERSTGMSDAKVLNIYNWGDYIDPKLITKFEKQTGYKVNYETFDSNEAMLTKIKQGGTSYDIAVPSDYMIQKMKKEHLLLKLDHSKLTNLKNIDPQFMDLAFDRHNEYSVPYFWGTLGIIYNDKFYQASQFKTWNDLWDPQLKNKIMFIDGAREFMGIGLASMQRSLNSKSDAELDQAYNKLKALTPNAKAIVSDEIKTYMANEDSSVAVTFSGEAADMMEKNSHLHYVLPNGGTNLWFDNLVIPKTAKNKQGAYEFINFMLDPKNAAQNTEYIGYSTPNKAALKYLPKAITSNKEFYPSAARIKQMEIYEDLGPKYLEKYNDLFLELKMYRN